MARDDDDDNDDDYTLLWRREKKLWWSESQVKRVGLNFGHFHLSKFFSWKKLEEILLVFSVIISLSSPPPPPPSFQWQEFWEVSCVSFFKLFSPLLLQQEMIRISFLLVVYSWITKPLNWLHDWSVSVACHAEVNQLRILLNWKCLSGNLLKDDEICKKISSLEKYLFLDFLLDFFLNFLNFFFSIDSKVTYQETSEDCLPWKVSISLPLVSFFLSIHFLRSLVFCIIHS